MLTAGAHRYRRYLILAAVLLACSLYAWQVAGAWGEEENQAANDQLAQGANVLGRYGTYGMAGSVFFQRSIRTVELKGVGIAAGATGSLIFNTNTRYPTGQLHVQDLPVLPDLEVYQLWCTDAAGTVDAASAFRMPIDTEGNATVSVIAPRLLYGYTHFRITIQPVGDRTVPGMVVMVD